METFSKKLREKTYTRGDFDLSIKVDEAHLYFEAHNQKTFTYYTLSLSNKTIEESTQHLFSNIDDLFDVLTNVLDAKNNSKPNGIYVKFNKKEVYFFMKIEFSLPIKKTSSFYLYLKPQGLGAPTKKIHSQLEELSKKVMVLEKFIENNPMPNGFSEKIKKLESFLERNSKKNENHSQNSTPNPKETKKFEPQKPVSMNKYINSSSALEAKKLSFDSKINPKYFKYKLNDTRISRTNIEQKKSIFAWGNTAFNKKSSQWQFFTIKIEKLNPEFEIINACVGIMTNDGFNKLDNLADHSGEGCYLYGLSSQFFWINNVKTKIMHRFGKINDLIKVFVNFYTRKIKWVVNETEVGMGELDGQEIGGLDFYPVVTLAFNKEAVSINGYMFE